MFLTICSVDGLSIILTSLPNAIGPALEMCGSCPAVEGDDMKAVVKIHITRDHVLPLTISTIDATSIRFTISSEHDALSDIQ